MHVGLIRAASENKKSVKQAYIIHTVRTVGTKCLKGTKTSQNMLLVERKKNVSQFHESDHPDIVSHAFSPRSHRKHNSRVGLFFSDGGG